MAPPFHCLIDRHSGVPVYRQLVDQVRFQVAAGTLEEGAELPSTRSLSSDHGVNPMTISKAYAELERMGVIERRPGRPSVVAERPSSAQEEAGREQLRLALAPAVSAIRQLGDPLWKRPSRPSVNSWRRTRRSGLPSQRPLENPLLPPQSGPDSPQPP